MQILATSENNQYSMGLHVAAIGNVQYVSYNVAIKYEYDLYISTTCSIIQPRKRPSKFILHAAKCQGCMIDYNTQFLENKCPSWSRHQNNQDVRLISRDDMC